MNALVSIRVPWALYGLVAMVLVVGCKQPEPSGYPADASAATDTFGGDSAVGLADATLLGDSKGAPEADAMADGGGASDSSMLDAMMDVRPSETTRGLAPTPAPVDVDLVDWVSKRVKVLPGSGSAAYSPPDNQQLQTFRAAIVALNAKKMEETQNLLASIGYQLQLWRDTGAPASKLPTQSEALIWALTPTKANTTHRGFFFLRDDPQVDVVFEAPHARYDTRSGVVAAEAFRALHAHSFVFNGTHRCANPTESGCSGTTGACGSKAPYRESDMAHTAQAFFQAFHEELYLDSTSRVAVQIHGFKSNADDPEFIVSNGTSQNKVGGLANEISAALVAKLQATQGAKPGNSCNATGQINKLCGTTNTQGRFTNGVPHSSVCETAAKSTNERFIHLELSYDLRNPGGKFEPTLVVEGLKSIFVKN